MKRILVVEDDPDIRESLVDFYGSLGYAAEGAANGADALVALHALTRDLVVLDLMMPVMNGWELADEMRRDPTLRDVHVVAFTASSRPPPDGVAEVVRKPADLDVLAAIAARHAGMP